MKRVNITIDDALLNRIDSYSKKRYVSRSGLIALVLSSYLDYNEENSSTTSPDSRSSNGSEDV